MQDHGNFLKEPLLKNGFEISQVKELLKTDVELDGAKRAGCGGAAGASGAGSQNLYEATRAQEENSLVT